MHNPPLLTGVGMPNIVHYLPEVIMTKIIGHRGAKGLELENTIQSFKRARQLGLDAIEFDIRATRDGKFIICHDDNLWRVSGKFTRVSKLSYDELAEIHLKNGETIPLLYDVLALLQDIPLILDLKTDQHPTEFFEIINSYPGLELTIVSRLPRAIAACKRLRPDIPVFAEWYLSAELLTQFLHEGADGLNLFYLWLNPFIYHYAKRHHMQLHVYTVNNVTLAKMLKKFFPDIWICTNHPDKLLAALFPRKKRAVRKAFTAL